MRFLYSYLFILPALLLASSSCIASENNNQNWSYDDDSTGQEDWGTIKGYEICEFGTNQSPVNIAYTKTLNLPPLNFKYSQANVTLKLNKQSFIMNVTDGGTIIDGNKSYILQSIEIHSPSSHRIRDRFYPVEIHLIHKDASGNSLIIAILTEIGNNNSAVETLLKQTNLHSIDKFTFNSDELLPTSRAYYSYNGSLPYPPCTENVKWRVLKTPITISTQQFSNITKYTGRNTRLPQPLYMRDVLESN